MRHRRAVCYGGEHFEVDWDGYLDRVDLQAPSLTDSVIGSQLSPANLSGMMSPGHGNEHAVSDYEGSAIPADRNGPQISMFSNLGGRRARS